MSEITCPLTESVQRSPDAVAILHGNDNVTYRELDHLANRITSYLTEKGVTAHDHVGLCGEVSTRWVAAFFALIRSRSVACPISPRLPVETLQKTVQSLSLSFILCVDSSSLAETSGVTEIILPQTENLPLADSLVNHALSSTLAVTAILTSGSSSQPKAALHSLGNHLFSAKGVNEYLSFGSQDRWLLSLPVHHVAGLAILFRTVVAGGTLVIPHQKESIVEAIVSNNVTHLSLVSTQLRQLMDSPAQLDNAGQHLKAILLGGSTFPTDLLERALESNLPLYLSYGLTEMSSTVTARCLTKPLTLSCGKPLPHRSVRISEGGEIEVAGETMFLGYLGETKTALTKDGWFCTGDTGQLDHNNELTVTGRIDSLIISGGENIKPEEIEAALCALESIDEAVVVAIDDEKFGQRPVAFIRVDNNYSINETALRDELTASLESFKIPDYVFELPPSDAAAIKPSRVELAALANRLIIATDN